MKPPTSCKEVHPIIGVVNYYRNVWARFTHTLAPLTQITPSKVKLKWTKIKSYAFDRIKQIVAHDNLLACPSFNEEI